MVPWKKGLLLGALVWAHMAVIFGIGASPGGATLQPESYGPVLQAQLNSFAAVAPPQAPESGPSPTTTALAQPQAGRWSAEKALVAPATRNRSDSNETEKRQPLKTEDFFSPDEVDQTANPVGNFEETLRQGLPLYVHGLVLEFWVDSAGNTVQVRCVEGDCGDAMTAGLEQLFSAMFQPAAKDGVAVPSRKLIQIDPSPLL